MPVANDVKQAQPESALPRWVWPRAAYLHVPFCAHRCGYCDFATVAGMDQLADRYLDALEKEIATLGEPQPVETIFIGGGTPTYLGHRQLDRLMSIVNQWFPLRARSVSEDRTEPSLTLRALTEREFTVEANPGTLDAEKVAILADHGVNRVSLGAQSFHPHLLQVLERNHDPADVPRAVELVRQRIDEVSLDLIFGVPGQSLEEWRRDLQTVVDLGVNHLSTYGLTYEKGTPLWKQRERGEVKPVDEDLERAMYEHAMVALEAAGFEHYEISNFARPGHRCRHNLVYWANEAYFGFGLGAARYVEGRREVNTRDLFGYIEKVMAGESAVQQSEALDPEERARETAVLMLRVKEGIERAAFWKQTGFDLDTVARRTIERFVRRGLLEDSGDRVSLTREGKFLADSVFQDLLGCA
jgi:putative oxygen-independent coproporphyrinogen III oxidase